MAPFYCFQCQKELNLAEKPGRRETCPACQADLHCCRNCRFYDPVVYNECQEPMAERVLEKERANFCDYFECSTKQAGTDQPNVAARQKLADLFKKG